jgi:uncharacterized integral membrane protein
MVKFLKLVVLVPIGLIALAFAVGNRHDVTVTFDPFSGNDPSLQVTAPLFILLLLALALGVILGSAATWVAQGRSRKAARLARAEAERLRQETTRIRAQSAAPTGTSLAVARPSAYER